MYLRATLKFFKVELIWYKPIKEEYLSRKLKQLYKPRNIGDIGFKYAIYLIFTNKNVNYLMAMIKKLFVCKNIASYGILCLDTSYFPTNEV